MEQASSLTSVYQYRDAYGVLIYVGITKRGATRNAEHNAGKPWWPYVASQDVEHFPTRELAHAREVDLIERHAPPFNVQHNRAHARMLAAYLTVAEAVESARDPIELKRTLESRLPLHVIGREQDGSGDRVALRTEAAHAAIAVHLRHTSATRLFLGEGLRVGHVLSVSQRGPFAVVQAQVRLGIEFNTAVGQLKQIMVKGPPVLELKRVRLDSFM